MQNVRRKQEQQEAHKKKTLEGMKRAQAEIDVDSNAEDSAPTPVPAPGRGS